MLDGTNREDAGPADTLLRTCSDQLRVGVATGGKEFQFGMNCSLTRVRPATSRAPLAIEGWRLFLDATFLVLGSSGGTTRAPSTARCGCSRSGLLSAFLHGANSELAPSLDGADGRAELTRILELLTPIRDLGLVHVILAADDRCGGRPRVSCWTSSGSQREVFRHARSWR